MKVWSQAIPHSLAMAHIRLYTVDEFPAPHPICNECIGIFATRRTLGEWDDTHAHHKKVSLKSTVTCKLCCRLWDTFFTEGPSTADVQAKLEVDIRYRIVTRPFHLYGAHNVEFQGRPSSRTLTLAMLPLKQPGRHSYHSVWACMY